MTASSKPRRNGAARAKDDINDRVTKAMRAIERDIAESYDPKTGFYRYRPNKGRLSVAEVLRRAGNVDKNTLKQPYHARLKEDVDQFVAAQGSKLLAHDLSARRNEANEARSDAELINWYAQVANAAEARADAADRARRDAEGRSLVLEEERAMLATLVEELRVQLSEGRVIRFPRK
jgi:hypothetical protein